MTSVSTRFLGQPSETKCTFMTRRGGSLAPPRRTARLYPGPLFTLLRPRQSGKVQHDALAELLAQVSHVALHVLAAQNHGPDLGIGQDLGAVGLAQHALQGGHVDAAQRLVDPTR